jgi:hypothetical protein
MLHHVVEVVAVERERKITLDQISHDFAGRVFIRIAPPHVRDGL